MNLVGYTATALSRNDIEDTPTNKNVVDFAIVELKDLQGNLVVMYDDAEGLNPETQKTCDTNGQVTFFAEIGDYNLEINGKAQRINLAANIADYIKLETGESVQEFANSFALKIFQSPTDGGLTKIQTRTVSGVEVYEVRKTSDDSLATIYSDAAGTAEIVQDGIDNVSGSDGVVEFYIADGDYYVEVGGIKGGFITLLKTDFENVEDAKNYSGIETLLGSRIYLKDRKAYFYVVETSNVNPDGYGVIQSSSNVNYSLDIDINGVMLIENFGATDGNSSGAIEAAILSCSGIANLSTNLSASVLDRPLYFLNNTVSDIDIDFSKCDLSLTGARTEGTTFDWEYGAFTFHGEVTEVTQDTTIPATLEAGRNFWEVTDSSIFSDGDFIIIEVDPDNDPDNGGNFSTKIVWKMVKVTKIDSSTQIRTDYIRGYDIELGTKIRYTKVNPVSNVSFKAKSLTYDRAYNGTNQDKLEASSGIVFYIAEGCEVNKFKYNNNPKQAAHFEFTHRCKAERVEMRSPIEVGSGGYCTQFAKSMLFEVNDIDSDEDRHLFDITASSNGKVANSGGSDTTNSTFTTHGTYEHDVIYDGNYGHFQVAGSGADFGESARRIKVINHNGTQMRAVAKVDDLTVEDSVFISTFRVNADGLTLKNTDLSKNIIEIHKISSNSSRMNVIDNCIFDSSSSFLDDANLDSDLQLTVKNSQILNFNDFDMSSNKVYLTLENCNGDYLGGSTVPISVDFIQLKIKGGSYKGMLLNYSSSNDNDLELSGGAFINKENRGGTLALVDVAKTGGSFIFTCESATSETANRHITCLTNGADLMLNIQGWMQKGGTNRVDLTSIGSGYLLFSNNVQVGVTNTFPADDGIKVITGNNISI